MTTKCRILSLAAVAALFPVAAMTVSAADGDTPAPAPAKTADAPAKTADAPAPEKKSDAPAADPMATAVAAHKTMTEAKAAYDKAAKPHSDKMAELQAKYAAATTDEEKKAIGAEITKARGEMTKETTPLQKASRDASTAFNTAFGATDWDKWDLKANRAVVEDGLKGYPMGAKTRDERNDRAVKAAEWAMKKLGECAATSSLVAGGYADAINAKEKDKAVVLKKLKEVSKFVKGEDIAGFNADVGDLQLLSGDIEGAMATFKAGRAAQKDDKNSAIKQRADLIGKVAPEINSKVWLGGEAKPLSALKGKVVVMDFFATWCPPCRAALPGLGEMAHDYAGKPVQVLSVVKQEASGALPKDKAGVPKGPYDNWKASKEATAGEDKGLAEYMEHVKAFYEVADLGYPFVVSNKDEQKPYGVTGIPCIFVLDADGKIVFIQNGFGGNHDDLKTAVDLALKRVPAKADAAKSADAPKADATKGGEPKADTASPAAPAKS
jgi:thiol-disulfide isomerase/thioredoxin